MSPLPITDPVSAAAVAMMHGGFTTPAIEAFRILDDARRTLPHGGPSEELAAAARNTLKWLHEHRDDADVVDSRERWERTLSGYATPLTPELVDILLFPVLWRESYGAFHAGFAAANPSWDWDAFDVAKSFVSWARSEW